MRATRHLRPAEHPAQHPDCRQRAARQAGAVVPPQEVNAEECKRGHRMARRKAVAGPAIHHPQPPMRHISDGAAKGHEIPGATGAGEALERGHQHQTGDSDGQPVHPLAPRRSGGPCARGIPGQHHQKHPGQQAPAVVQQVAGQPGIAPGKAGAVAVPLGHDIVAARCLPGEQGEQARQQPSRVSALLQRPAAHFAATAVSRHSSVRSQAASRVWLRTSSKPSRLA